MIIGHLVSFRPRNAPFDMACMPSGYWNMAAYIIKLAASEITAASPVTSPASQLPANINKPADSVCEIIAIA